MSSELEFLQSMTDDERQSYFLQQYVDSEEGYLNWMIERNKEDDATISELAELARLEVDSNVEKAEAYLEMIRSFKENRFTIKDIRAQREKVQWARRRLKTHELATELKQSSES